MASPSSSTSSSTSYNAATGAETVTVTTTVYDAALGASVGTGQVYSGQQAPQAPVLNPPSASAAAPNPQPQPTQNQGQQALQFGQPKPLWSLRGSWGIPLWVLSGLLVLVVLGFIWLVARAFKKRER